MVKFQNAIFNKNAPVQNNQIGIDCFFAFSAGLSLIGMLHFIAIGVVSELIVSASDHSHGKLPSLTQKTFFAPSPEEWRNASLPGQHVNEV